MFGNTLSEVMELQREIFPERKIPWIQRTLTEQILQLSGKQTEGIFRVPADVDEVMCLKAHVDKWEFPENKGTMGESSPVTKVKDARLILLFIDRRSCAGWCFEVVVPRAVRPTDT
jgi:Rho GTPase-activating protein 39